MAIDGRPYRPTAPFDAVERGVVLVPEERRSSGLVLDESVRFNLNLPHLRRSAPRWAAVRERPQEQRAARTVIDRLKIKAEGVDTPVRQLSGGNQQKVVIGKWLGLETEVLILDEPSRGVDVGARTEIHHLIRELAERGAAVSVISSDNDELPGLCDRVLVMTEGRVSGELRGDAITKEGILHLRLRAHRMRKDGMDSNPNAPVVDDGGSDGARRFRRRSFAWLAKYGTLVGMALMIVAFSLAAPGYFFTVSNFVNILNQASLTAIIAGGLTVAVIVGEDVDEVRDGEEVAGSGEAGTQSSAPSPPGCRTSPARRRSAFGTGERRHCRRRRPRARSGCCPCRPSSCGVPVAEVEDALLGDRVASELAGERAPRS